LRRDGNTASCRAAASALLWWITLSAVATVAPTCAHFLAVDKRFVAHFLGELVRDYRVQSAHPIAGVSTRSSDSSPKPASSSRWSRTGRGWRDMGPSVDAFETACCARSCGTLGTVLDWNVGCAVTISDPTRARRVVKDKATGRIDGLVAGVMAVGAAVKVAPKRESVYKSRGLVTLRVA
jgi:hypothetical protein